MGRYLELVEQRFIVQAVGREAVQVYFALRRKPDLIGEAGEIVLTLAVAAADGIYRLAAIAEFAQRFTDILHRWLIAAGKVLQIQHDTGDIAVVFRLANGLHNIEQRVFLQAIGAGAKQLAANYAKLAAGRGFIDHHAGDIQQQRAAGTVLCRCAAELGPDADAGQHQHQENHVQCELANKIEHAPCPFKKSGEQSPKSSHVFSLTIIKNGRAAGAAASGYPNESAVGCQQESPVEL